MLGGNVSVSGKGKRKFFCVSSWEHRRVPLIECGCTPRSYAKTDHLFKRGIFLPVSVSSRRPCCHQRQRCSGFSPVVAQPECSFSLSTPSAPCGPRGNDNSFGLAAINDFLRGFADIVWLGEFAIHQRTEFFLVRLNQLDVTNRQCCT